MATQKSNTIWFDGQLVPWDEATVHVGAHALHYGSSVFEGIRAYALPDGPAIMCLEEHLDRLWDSARIYRLEIPYSREEIREAMPYLQSPRVEEFIRRYRHREAQRAEPGEQPVRPTELSQRRRS